MQELLASIGGVVKGILLMGQILLNFFEEKFFLKKFAEYYFSNFDQNRNEEDEDTLKRSKSKVINDSNSINMSVNFNNNNLISNNNFLNTTNLVHAPLKKSPDGSPTSPKKSDSKK